MKKAIPFLLCLFIFSASYYSCRKIAHANELPIVNTGDTSNLQASSITISGTVTTNDAPIQSSGHVWSSVNQLPGYTNNEGRSTIRGLLPKNKIITTLTNLTGGKTYYIRGYVIAGVDTVYGKVIPVDIVNTSGVAITTGQVSNITSASADVGATISLPANKLVSQHGHVWSVTNNIPTLSDSSTKLGALQTGGKYSSSLNNLSQGATYYVRAYIISDSITLYGNVVSFATISNLAPTVITNIITNITAGGATAGGNISAIGSTSVTQYGHVWSSSNNLPTINDSKTLLGAAGAPVIYNSTLANLSPGTTYYTRAYATNTNGTAYGSVISFTTIASGTNLPSVVTGNIGGVRFDGVDAGGTVTDIGSSQILSYGFVFSDYSYFPDTYVNVVHDLGVKSTTGSFTGIVTKLKPGTHYWMRAFATNTNGTAYGDTLSFTTKITIVTSQIFSVSATATQLYGLLDASPGVLSTVYEYGHVYSSANPLPTINDSKIKNGPASGFLGWGSTITGLATGMKYYVRSYGINDAGIEYGDTVSFIAGIPFTASLPVMGPTSTTGAQLEFIAMTGTVLSIGSSPLTHYGYVYSANNKLPTVNDSKVDLGASSTVYGFSTILPGLRGGTTYYIRPYAVNSTGISYGLLTPYTTLNYILPDVSTGDPALQTPNVNFPGNLIYSGNTAVTQHGHVWSTTNHLPTLSDNFNQLGPAPQGIYNSLLGTDIIKSGTTYYIRAYATNNGGTVYGDVKTFSY